MQLFLFFEFGFQYFGIDDRTPQIEWLSERAVRCRGACRTLLFGCLLPDVVPKKEVDYIFDLDDQTLAGMMLFAKKIARRIERQIDCKRVAVVVLGLEVPHAHIHLIPIKSESDVDFRREKLFLTPEEFQAIAAKLNR